MGKKCTYSAPDERTQLEANCTTDDEGFNWGEAYHYEDIEDWEFCPSCGRKIRIEIAGKHIKRED